MVEVREVLRAWLEGHGLRKVAERAGVDRKTARRYVAAAEDAGLTREAGVESVTDELVGEVVDVVRPARPNGHGASWELLLGHEEQIRTWVSGGRGEEPLSIVKIEELLARQGVRVPYRTLHRFAVERCGFGARWTTVRVVDGEPGVECQLDFTCIAHPRRRGPQLVHTQVFDWAPPTGVDEASVVSVAAARFFGVSTPVDTVAAHPALLGCARLDRALDDLLGGSGVAVDAGADAGAALWSASDDELVALVRATDRLVAPHGCPEC